MYPITGGLHRKQRHEKVEADLGFPENGEEERYDRPVVYEVGCEALETEVHISLAVVEVVLGLPNRQRNFLSL